MSSSSLQPTWYGYVSTARDALVLFEACLNGTMHHVARRPHDRERAQLIKSGYVFIYEENASGIKRWTDGVPWSPSRILGNFLVYRELEKPFPPGEKKRATKRSKRQSRPGEPYPRQDGQSPTSPTTPTSARSGESREEIRALIGSLVDSYGFKDEGLVKKTMSVNVHGVHHHLVSYYKVEDVLNGTLKTPQGDARLAAVEPRSDLIARQNFRAPLDDTSDEHADSMAAASHAYGYPTAYDPSRTSMLPPQYTGYGNVGHMSLYPNMPYSSSAYNPGMQSYAPLANQGYYQPQSHQQPSHVKPEDNRSSQLPSPGYGYRPPLPVGGIDQGTGPGQSGVKLEDSGLGRSQAGHYAPTAGAPSYLSTTQSNSIQTPSYASPGGYPFSGTQAQPNLPSIQNGYGQDGSGHYLGLHSPSGVQPRQSYGASTAQQ